MIKIKEKELQATKTNLINKSKNLTSSFLPQPSKLNYLFGKKASVPPLSGSFHRQKAFYNNRQNVATKKLQSQLENFCHKKSLSNNMCGDKLTDKHHGRSITILDLKKLGSNASVPKPNKELTFLYKGKGKSFTGELQKCHKRSFTSSPPEIEEKASESCSYFWKAKSSQKTPSENPYGSSKRSDDNIVVNNNISIEIKYTNDKKRSPIVFKSPDIKLFGERPVEEKRCTSTRQKKNLSVELSPSFNPVSPVHEQIQSKFSDNKSRAERDPRDFQIKLQLNISHNRQASSKKSFSGLGGPRQAFHPKSLSNFTTAVRKSALCFPNRGADICEMPISPFNKFSSPVCAKANLPTLHKKNAISPDLTALCAQPKRFYLPSSLAKQKSPQQLAKSSRIGAFASQKTQKLITAIQRPRENIVNPYSSQKIPGPGAKNVSLQSFCQEANSEIAETNEEEESNSQLEPKLNDSVVRHEVSSHKKKLCELIAHTCRLSKKVPPTSLHYYHISKALGEGSYAKVYLAFSVLAGLPVAIKCYEKANIKSESTFKCIMKEVEIMKGLNHPNIVRLIEIFEDEDHIFVVLEHADRGDLLSYVKNNGRLSEAEMARVLGQILNGLHYLHNNKILHRDIKLDNILLTTQGQIKICDFGVSTRVLNKTLIHEHIGTPAYLAPEIIEGGGYTGFQVDVWSLGVMAFICVLGVIPFRGEAIPDLNKNILHSEPYFPENHGLSPTMHGVLSGMLKKNPRSRLTVQKTAALLGIKLHATPPEGLATKLSAQVRQNIVELGYSDECVEATVKKGAINHISALAHLFHLHG